jgi:hypothetical protein
VCELTLSQNTPLGKVFWDTNLGHENLKITVTFAGCPTFPKLTWECGKGKNPYAMRVTAGAVPLSQNTRGKWDSAAPYPVPLSHPPTVGRGGTGGKGGVTSIVARARQDVIKYAFELDQPTVIATVLRDALLMMLLDRGYTDTEVMRAYKAMIWSGGLVELHCGYGPRQKVQVVA